MKRILLLLAGLAMGFVILPKAVYASPITSNLSVAIVPEQMVPASAGFVYVGGGYPLRVSVSLDGQPLSVFWTGEGYEAVFSYGFEEPPGDHTVEVHAENPLTGEQIDQVQTITVLAYAYPREQIALPFSLIPLLDRDLNEAEVSRLDAIYAVHSYQESWDWPYALPVPGGIITSRFGGDRTYNGGLWAAHHTGIDFRRTVGEPVLAAASGRVAAASMFDVRGNVIIIDHGHGVFSQYAHLSELYVNVGAPVFKGQLIGAAGATGRSNGPHLHFEVIVNGIPIDPLPWFALAPNYVPPKEVDPSQESTGS
jgi:murein DD-endopeptidase MepM/ murein hydrolase activator NlpD